MDVTLKKNWRVTPYKTPNDVDVKVAALPQMLVKPNVVFDAIFFYPVV